MLYRALRAAARIALRWYYGDVVVQGRERIPANGPVLVVANHPNALVDALLIVASVNRRVLLTAKATLFEHPLMAPFLAAAGVVPLRRAKDERMAARTGMSVSRNDDTFRMVSESLRHERVVLVFPEGVSHDKPALEPLKSGAARMALAARTAGAHSLHILPIGLVYEEKERPRSRILVRAGEPIDLDSWCTIRSTSDAAALTREIDVRLRHVTLNFATSQRAARAVYVARALSALANEPKVFGQDGSLALQAVIAARVEAATDALELAPPELSQRADVFVKRLEALEAGLQARGAALEDTRVSLHVHRGVWFVLREGALVVLALPVALFGRVSLWPPIRLGRALAMGSIASDSSRDQPAMRTILLTSATLLAWYALQAVVITLWLGGVAAVLWLIVIFLAAQADLLFEDRLGPVSRRARTYLVLRHDPVLRSSSLAECDALLAESLALESALRGT